MLDEDIQIREILLNDNGWELRQVQGILSEGAELMGKLGKTRWETDQLELGALAAAAQAHELFVVLMQDQLVGTFKVQTEDTLFWPEMNRNEAVYLHKIALTKAARGLGLTLKIIQWAKLHAASQGRKFVRLDTDRARPGLCRLYSGLGLSVHSYKKLDWIEVIRFQGEVELSVGS